MKESLKIEKIKSIIESCEEYSQIRTCFAFVNYPSFIKNESNRWIILRMIQDKLYSMRKSDIEKMKVFINKNP